MSATAPDRPRAADCGAIREPKMCHVEPSTAPTSAPSVLSDRSVRLVTRGGTEACSSSMPQDSVLPAIVAITMLDTRPKRGSSSSTQQNPSGAYSNTLLNMSPRDARAQVRSRTASNIVGPCASKRNGYSET